MGTGKALGNRGETFECQMCGGVFRKGLGDEKSNAEAESYWGVSDASRREDMAVVCDDCWNAIRPTRPMDGRFYLEGRRRFYLALLKVSLKELGADDTEAGRVRWLVERQEVVALLRQVCAKWGDNSWTDDLNLSDVIEKHLCNHLDGEK